MSVHSQKQQNSKILQMPSLSQNLMYSSSIQMPIGRRQRYSSLNSRVNKSNQLQQLLGQENMLIQGQEKKQNGENDSFMSEIHLMQKKIKQFQEQVQSLRHENRRQRFLLNQKDEIIQKFKFQSLNTNKQINGQQAKILSFKSLQHHVFSFLGEVDIITKQLPSFYEKEKNHAQNLTKTLKILREYKEQNNQLKDKVRNLSFEITLKQNSLNERLIEKKHLQDKNARLSQFNFQLQQKISHKDQEIQNLNRQIDSQMKQKLEKQFEASRMNRLIQDQTKYLKTQIKNITEVVRRGNESHQKSQQRSKKKYQQALEEKRNIVKVLQTKIKQLQQTVMAKNEHIQRLQLTLQRHSKKNWKLYSMAKQFSQFCDKRQSIRNIGKAKQNRMDQANKVYNFEKAGNN